MKKLIIVLVLVIASTASADILGHHFNGKSGRPEYAPIHVGADNNSAFGM